jgi:hypothetical protein
MMPGWKSKVTDILLRVTIWKFSGGEALADGE